MAGLSAHEQAVSRHEEAMGQLAGLAEELEDLRDALYIAGQDNLACKIGDICGDLSAVRSQAAESFAQYRLRSTGFAGP